MKLKFTFSLMLLGLLPLLSLGQAPLKQVLFTTGGTFQGTGNLVTFAAFNIVGDSLRTIDQVPGDFSNAVLVEENTAYAHFGRADGNPAGADVLYKYEISTGARIDSIPSIPGLVNLTLHEDYLFVNRGFGATSDYFQIYDKNDLAAGPIFSDSMITSFTEDAVVLGDRAYVSYSAQDSGRLGIFSLSTPVPVFLTSVAFDTLTNGLDELYTNGTEIIGLAERVVFPPPNFFPVTISAGVLSWNPQTDVDTFYSLNQANGGIGLVGNSLYADYSSGPGIFDLGAEMLTINPFFDASFTAARFDTVGERFVYQATDFFSTGYLIISDQEGVNVDTIQTDISGSALALDYNSFTTSVEPNKLGSYSVYPNPTTGLVNIEHQLTGTVNIRVMNVNGQQLKLTQLNAQQGTISLEGLAPGLYFVELSNQQARATRKIWLR